MGGVGLVLVMLRCLCLRVGKWVIFSFLVAHLQAPLEILTSFVGRSQKICFVWFWRLDE